jgi:hypothetical protein
VGRCGYRPHGAGLRGPNAHRIRGVRSGGVGYTTRALHFRLHTTEKEAEMYIGGGVLLLILIIVLLIILL